MNTTNPGPAISTDYGSPLNRMLYDSPLHTRKGKILLALIAVLLLYPFLNVWHGWLSPLENSWMLFSGMALAFVGSLPALAFLRYLDRRQPESWIYYTGVLLFGVLFSTASAAFFNHHSPMPPATVGFNEEFWKVLPLLLVVFFAPTLVSGIRDGIIYGALGGLAFDVAEIGNYLLRFSGREGIDGFIFQMGRLGFGGIENHVIWSALVGAGIGAAVQSRNRRTKVLAPLGAYLLAALTHDFQDFMGGPLLTIAATSIILKLQGIDLMSLDKATGERLARSNSADALRLETLFVNLIVLPLLGRLLWKSGDWERDVVRDELADEAAPVITPSEYEGVRAEKRFRLRSVPGYPPRTARSIRTAQNNLAFHKRYLKRKNRPVEGDPLIEHYRTEVSRLRGAVGTQV